MENNKSPIYNMITNYGKSMPLPFHMPGHLMGRGLPDLLKNAGMLDITEIPGADCLHNPEGVIAEAQILAARLFGAERTFFLVNGSTIGIHAMMRSVVKPGGKILIGRDSHRSVLNAAALLGANPYFIMPEYDEKEHLALGYDVESIKKALSENPDIQAVLLSRPNYFGIATRLEAISEIVHSYGIPLLIDEAHGAHFSFEQSFPVPALKSGADVCVQSLHKTLPALTQTALLHISKNSLVDPDTLFEQLSMLQTTSPSYILLASIDIAREVMEEEGEALYASLKKRIETFYLKLGRIPGVRRAAVSKKYYDTDFTRIVLSFEESGLSGFDAERILRESSLIYPEMADSHHVVLIATPYHTEKDFLTLLEGIKLVIKKGNHSDIKRITEPIIYSLPEKRLSLCEAINRGKKLIMLSEAEGQTAGAAITPFPPGIPLVYPGEVISRELIRYATEILDSGGKVHGIMDYKVRVIK